MDKPKREVRIITAEAQLEVKGWIEQTFGTESNVDVKERCQRFLEEALEVVQSAGMSRKEADKILTYVYTRPVEPKISTEIGGAFTTLCALSNAVGEDIGESYDVDRAKRWANMDKIRAKQEMKAAKGVGESYVRAVK